MHESLLNPPATPQYISLLGMRAIVADSDEVIFHWLMTPLYLATHSHSAFFRPSEVLIVDFPLPTTILPSRPLSRHSLNNTHKRQITTDECSASSQWPFSLFHFVFRELNCEKKHEFLCCDIVYLDSLSVCIGPRHYV